MPAGLGNTSKTIMEVHPGDLRETHHAKSTKFGNLARHPSWAGKRQAVVSVVARIFDISKTVLFIVVKNGGFPIVRNSKIKFLSNHSPVSVISMSGKHE